MTLAAARGAGVNFRHRAHSALYGRFAFAYNSLLELNSCKCSLLVRAAVERRMRQLFLGRILASIAALIGIQVSASAAPITYTLEPASQATIFVNAGTTPLLSDGNFTTSLTGTVEIDLQAETVNSFSVEFPKNTLLTFEPGLTYGGVTSVVIDSATLFSSDPFTGMSVPLVTGLFTYVGNTAEVSGVYDIGFGPFPISYGGSSIDFQVNSFSTVVVTGQNLAGIDGSAFGETESLNIAASLTMFLAQPVTPVPEPRAAILFLVSLLVLRRR